MGTAVLHRGNSTLRGAYAVGGTALFFCALVVAMWLYKASYDGTERDRAEVNYIKGVLRGGKTGLTAAEEGRLARHILKESRAYSLDPIFVLALIKTESRYNNWSRSGKGAMGLMQILPDTGEELARALRLEWKGKATLLDPYTNVKFGIHYYSALRGRFYNNTRGSLSAYNAGYSRASADGRASRTFAERVLNNYRELKERAKRATPSNRN